MKFIMEGSLKRKIQLGVFAVLVIILIVGLVILLIADQRRARLKDADKLREMYLKAIMDQQRAEEAKKPKMTLDEAKKELPNVDKVDFEP